MSSFLDANIVIRYLVGDEPSLAERAAGIVDHVEDLLVAPVVLAEIAYVLASVYRIPREPLVDQLITFVQKDNISVSGISDKGLVIQALLLCRPSSRVSFADAMVWALATSSGARVVYSFDESFPSDGLEVRQNP